MLLIAWRLDWFLATFFRTKRTISKYGANSLLATDVISNEKIKSTLNFEFQSIESVIQEVVDCQQK
jgi:uncharacterized protein (DUF1684 family)